jgi:hypothetical protein
MSAETLPRTNTDPSASPDMDSEFEVPAYMHWTPSDGEGHSPASPEPDFSAPEPETHPAPTTPEAEPLPSPKDRLAEMTNFGDTGIPTADQIGQFPALLSEFDVVSPTEAVHRDTGEKLHPVLLLQAERALAPHQYMLSREDAKQRIADSRAPMDPTKLTSEQQARFKAYSASPELEGKTEKQRLYLWKKTNGAAAKLSGDLHKLEKQAAAEEAATAVKTGEADDTDAKLPKPEKTGERGDTDTTYSETDTVAPMPRGPRNDFKTKMKLPKLSKKGSPKYTKPTARSREEIQALMAPKLEHRGDVIAQIRHEGAVAYEELARMKPKTSEYYLAKQRVDDSLKRRAAELKATKAYSIEAPEESDPTTEDGSGPDRMLTDEELYDKYGRRPESPRRRIFSEGDDTTTVTERFFDGGKKGGEYKRFAGLFDEVDETASDSHESRGRIRARLRRFGGFVLRNAENAISNASGLNAAEDVREEARGFRAKRSAARAAEATATPAAPAEAADPFAPTPETKKQRIKRVGRRAGRAVMKGLAASGAAQFGVPPSEIAGRSEESAPSHSTQEGDDDSWIEAIYGPKAPKTRESDPWATPNTSVEDAAATEQAAAYVEKDKPKANKSQDYTPFI